MSSEFDDLFAPKKEESKSPKIKKERKQKIEFTEDDINLIINKLEQKITITKLMHCYETLTGTSIRENKDITIDEIVYELGDILLTHRLKNIEITKEDVKDILHRTKDVIEIINNSRELEES